MAVSGHYRGRVWIIYREQVPVHLQAFLLIRFEPSFWPEDIHVLAEDGLVSMQYPGIDAYDCATRQLVAVDHGALARCFTFNYCTRVRMDAECLLDHGITISQHKKLVQGYDRQGDSRGHLG